MKKNLLLIALALTGTLEAKELKIMQYNAENFFDTKHDVGTQDYTYLPVSLKRKLQGHREYCESISSEFYRNECLNLDWTEDKMTKKIIGLAKVIKSFDKSGKGPDIIILEEVENVNVLNKLVTKGLDKLGYIHQVLIEGDDSRGIDVGIISKIPVTESKHHSLIVNGSKLDTRGILEVQMNLQGKDVVVFANHWPSQNNPSEERVASAKLLASLAHKSDADLIVAAGDFNTLDSESPYPFEYMKDFVDAEQAARDLGVSMNGGTHYYRGEWSSLDRIFIHKKSKLRPAYETFQIMVRSFMMKTDPRTGESVPVRFDASSGNGYSDHLPVSVNISY